MAGLHTIKNPAGPELDEVEVARKEEQEKRELEQIFGEENQRSAVQRSTAAVASGLGSFGKGALRQGGSAVWHGAKLLDSAVNKLNEGIDVAIHAGIDRLAKASASSSSSAPPPPAPSAPPDLSYGQQTINIMNNLARPVPEDVEAQASQALRSPAVPYERRGHSIWDRMTPDLSRLGSTLAQEA